MSALVNITILVFCMFTLGLVVGYCFAYAALLYKAKGSIKYAIDEDDHYLFLALQEPADIFIQHKFVVLEVEKMTT